MNEQTDCIGEDDGDALDQRMLQNEELVTRILEPAENLSSPLAAEEFMEWLRRSAGDAAPP